MDDVAEFSPPSQSELLRGLTDDDDTAEPMVVESPRSTGVVTRSRATPPAARMPGRATLKKSGVAPMRESKIRGSSDSRTMYLCQTVGL